MTEGDGLLLISRKWQYISVNWTEEQHARDLSGRGSPEVKYRAVFRADTCIISSTTGRLEGAGDAISQFVQARLVPFVYQRVSAEERGDGSEEQWDRLQRQGIISPSETRAGAVAALRAPKTHNEVRISGNYKVTVNPRLQANQYPIPTP